MKNIATFSFPTLLLCSIALFTGVLASTSAIGAPSVDAHSPPASVSEVFVDDDSGSVSVRVNGKTILTIDHSGITVTGNIQYTGQITDTGEDVPAITSDGGAN